MPSQLRYYVLHKYCLKYGLRVCRTGLDWRTMCRGTIHEPLSTNHARDIPSWEEAMKLLLKTILSPEQNLWPCPTSP